MSVRLPRKHYTDIYGPTTDDRVRLGDTDLWIRVGEDRQAPGDEPIWGYAKTLRPRATQGRASESELDVVIAGVLVLDPVIGVVKADIGIKDGRIVGVGRTGSHTLTEGIDLRIGPHTQSIMGYGLIATPGAVDSHVHLISPELLPAALSGGVTNWLAVHMLFEKVPLLYGSGVIPHRFEEFKAGIKQLIVQEFFTREHIERLFSHRGVTSADGMVISLQTVDRGSRGMLRVMLLGSRPGSPASFSPTRGTAVRAAGEAVADERLGLDIGERFTLGGQELTVVGLTSGHTMLGGTPDLSAAYSLSGSKMYACKYS